MKKIFYYFLLLLLPWGSQSADINFDIIPLRQASAIELTRVLNHLQAAGQNTEIVQRVAIVADEQHNSILLKGDRLIRLRLRNVIKQLDSGVTSARNTDVIYLKYLEARKIAPILNRVAEQMQPRSTVILPESTTNALIITSSASIIKNLHNIINKLDIRPAQVLVEGIIVELNQDDLKNFGIEWSGQLDKEKICQGLIGIISHQKLEVILSMLQNNRNANILSTPSVVVLDNHRALLDVGQDVPTKNGEYSSSGSPILPFNTISYKKVALTLEVIPQINLGNAVRLSVKLKNDSLQNPDKVDLTPLINTSQIINSVIVNNNDILVLGGLIRNSIIDNLEKVPILGDIPALGLLFQHTTRKLEKKNLLVFLKPVILYNGDQSDKLTCSKYNFIRNAQIDWPVDLNNPAAQKAENILPLWKEDVTLPLPFG